MAYIDLENELLGDLIELFHKFGDSLVIIQFCVLQASILNLTGEEQLLELSRRKKLICVVMENDTKYIVLEIVNHETNLSLL